jgi:DNA repair exonuclease SbcCD nuclease subunit
MPKLLMSADWHLRSILPRCRIDDNWLDFQESIVKEIVKITNNKKAILCLIGDIFDIPNVPSFITAMFLLNVLKVKMGTRILAGNHDLPAHSWANISNSSIGIINSIIVNGHHGLSYINELGSWNHFNEDVKNPNQELQFIHRLVFEKAKDVPPNISACSAQDLLDEFPNAKYIFTGDMHRAFHYEKKNRHVINPGCIVRQAADFKEYLPSVYFVDTDEDIIEQIFLPDNGEVVIDSYLREEEERVDRIEAFVEGVKKNGKVSLDFISNVNTALDKNKKMSKETILMINELMEDEK